MRMLHREDVEEAGYEMPADGLCANIDEFNLEALKYGGEWFLADDEVLVADGHEQSYLYLVVSGEVGIFKSNDQGQGQLIASLYTGDAFGEMAFLSGGVASANVQAVGECILWRIDHERLLEFIGENGAAGGQLCLNVASILSGRLVEGNRKVLDMGKELQASLHQMQAAAQAGAGKDQTLRQMQAKVKGLEGAFKGAAAQKKSAFGPLGIAAAVVAVLSLGGLVVTLAVGGGEEVAEGEIVSADELSRLRNNEEYYQEEEEKLKAEQAEEKEKLQARIEALAGEKESLLAQASESMTKDARIRDLEGDLADAKARLAASSSRPVAPTVPVAPTASVAPEAPAADDAAVLGWARINSTLLFPSAVQVKKPIILQDSSGQAKIPMKSGDTVKALRFYIHAGSPVSLIISQAHSDKFRAVMPVAHTNFVELARPKYMTAAKRAQKAAARPSPNAEGTGAASPRPGAATKAPPAASPASAPAPTSSAAGPAVTVGRPVNPQKPANLLDNVAPAPAPTPEPTGDTLEDHGANCVCRDCRAKKIGRGSLFPDL